jgi:demethylmenaquinone methyltransferase / 2-methoxy-6-polyprenyl-1,4-benzoquinol methylase
MSEKMLNMFTLVARRYDFMNDVLSFGIHRQWKRKLIKKANLKSGFSVLDCATGTGDIAFRFKLEGGKKVSVTGIDFNDQMLEIAKSRTNKKKLDISFHQEDVLNMTFGDNSFDVVSIAFGIRNVDDTLNCIYEMARVTQPGGKVLILEFGKPSRKILWIYKLYARFIIPLLGQIISCDRRSYSYLQSSALAYPCGNDFLSLMDSTNCFKECFFEPLSFGVAYLYVGVVK